MPWRGPETNELEKESHTILQQKIQFHQFEMTGSISN